MLSMIPLGSWPLWAGFLGFVLAMLALDLGVFHRKAHAVSMREAGIWSAVWVALAMVFAAGVFALYGPERGLEYATGYVIEKALSVDNVFVMVVVFAAFGIPAQQQHRVLFWGVLGALVFRAIFIVAGTALIERFHWTLYLFGGFLVLTGFKMLLDRGAPARPEDNVLVRAARRFLPVAPAGETAHFFTRVDGRRMVTPLFLALLTVELTDLVFAVDSIPAVLAVSRDPFIVFTSNVFAILGLRSLYFLLAGVVTKFRYLKVGLALVLVFVGLKMALVDLLKVPTPVSLAVIGLLIAGAVVASLIADARRPLVQRTSP